MREACHYGTHTETVTEEHAVAATDSPQKPDIAGFYHGPTSSCCFVVGDPATGACAIIDSVLDFDPVSARTATDFADSLVDHVRAQRLRVDWPSRNAVRVNVTPSEVGRQWEKVRREESGLRLGPP